MAALVALALATAGVVFAIVTFRAGANHPSAAVTLQNGPIALATGDPARITVVDQDGTDARQVTTGKEPDPRAEERGYFEESFPQWSPDGTEIAFVRWYDPGTSLCVIGVDGTGFRILVPEFHGGQLAWSPDGSTIAYSGDEAIHLVDADGSSDRALAGLPSAPDDHPPRGCRPGHPTVRRSPSRARTCGRSAPTGPTSPGSRTSLRASSPSIRPGPRTARGSCSRSEAGRRAAMAGRNTVERCTSLGRRARTFPSSPTTSGSGGRPTGRQTGGSSCQ